MGHQQPQRYYSRQLIEQLAVQSPQLLDPQPLDSQLSQQPGEHPGVCPKPGPSPSAQSNTRPLPPSPRLLTAFRQTPTFRHYGSVFAGNLWPSRPAALTPRARRPPAVSPIRARIDRAPQGPAPPAGPVERRWSDGREGGAFVGRAAWPLAAAAAKARPIAVTRRTAILPAKRRLQHSGLAVQASPACPPYHRSPRADAELDWACTATGPQPTAARRDRSPTRRATHFTGGT